MTAPAPIAAPVSLSAGSAVPDAPRSRRPHEGMPPLDLDGEPLSFFEFWPMRVFYLPVFLYALWLMVRYRGIALPTIVNPLFQTGGFYGESKADILSQVVRHAPDWVAQFVAIDRPACPDPSPAGRASELAEAQDALAAAGLTLPVVAKPDMGCRGVGVRLIRTAADLDAYLQAFPAGARLILQRFVDEEGEAGVFYARLPGESQGRVLSLTLKYFPHVIGDGRSTLEQLILADPRAGRVPHLYLPRHRDRLATVPAAGEAVRLAFAGSHSRGSIFRDGTALVTEAMRARFDAIAQSVPEFYFGRFDVRFRSFQDLQQGEGFTIIEVNGAGAEMTHIWDRRMTLWGAWLDLMGQYRLLYRIGRANRDRGFRPMSLAAFARLYRREQDLTARYPPTM